MNYNNLNVQNISLIFNALANFCYTESDLKEIQLSDAIAYVFERRNLQEIIDIYVVNNDIKNEVNRYINIIIALLNVKF